MASHDDDHVTTVYPDEDDDTEDEDPTLRNQIAEEDDVELIDEDEEDDSTSSGVGDVTIAVPGDTSTVTATPTETLTGTVNVVTVSPLPRSNIITEQRKITPLDESRRLFQRLWTDEDEIELLQGFLEYNNQRVANNPFHHHHHHDTTAFYEQIKDKLQLDFNKNQLVEKLRRLKKKYRNVLSKISSGKEYVFKSAHDQITFDICCKIWSNEGAIVSTPVTADVVRFDDEESHNPNLNTNTNTNLNIAFNLNEQNGNGVGCSNSLEKKVPRSRKRSRSSGVKVEEKVIQQQPSPPAAAAVASSNLNSIPILVEETVKSCLLPLFKEVLESRGSFRGFGAGGMNLDPFSLSLGGLMNIPLGDVTDEKWRKQHILELEVCSKRLELVQDKIKSQLEELKAMRRAWQVSRTNWTWNCPHNLWAHRIS